MLSVFSNSFASFSFYLNQGVRKNEEGIPEDEENFDEAVKSVNMALVPTKVKIAFANEKSNAIIL